MKRNQGVAALMAGTLIVLALLAVFAIELSDNQSTSRRSLQTEEHQRTVLVSNLIDAVFAQQAHIGAHARARLGAAHISAAYLQRTQGTNRYVAVLGPHGQVIAHSRGFHASDAAQLDGPGAMASIGRGRNWALGDVTSAGVVNQITGFQSPHGMRALVTGRSSSLLSAFVQSELAKVPGVAAQHQLLIDGNGVVVGSTVADRPAGYVLHTPAQRMLLTEKAGISRGVNGVRYFDSVPLANTPWRLLISIPSSQFFASVSGFRRYLPWVIFVAFGLVAIAALALVRRSIRAAERIRATNAQLISANVELNDAQVSLKQANEALAQTNGALERSNDELERQARELVRSNTELDQFASIASHDLQEPLRKVRTFTERLAETEAGKLSERGTDYLRRANASAERMQILIEDLLRFSRVSTQGRPFTPVDLTKVTADVLDDISEQISRSDARVEVGHLPTINADPPQMRQLMQNLISNALKFRREDVAPVVRVAARTEASWVTITVSDNGIGFDPQYSRRIFRVFERLHGRGTYPGTGIGLALCRKIAERHGGTIVAHSVPGEGSTFTVTMQTQRTAAVSDAPPEQGRAGGSATREEPYVTA